MLAIFIKRAKVDDQEGGVVPHLVDGSISILHDTLMIQFSFWNITWRRLKTWSCYFMILSNYRVWKLTSEIFCFGEAKEFEDQHMGLFGCNTGAFLMRYLGIPTHYRKLSNSDWLKVQERFEKCLSSWKGKNLSTGCRLTLINSVLSSLPMYMMSFFEIPKGVCKKLDYFRSRFFWQSDEHKRKYRLAKWDILC